MARRGHSAVLPLVGRAAVRGRNGDPGLLFRQGPSGAVVPAVQLPAGARRQPLIYWTYHPGNGTADIEFRAPQSSDGWVAWGINTQSAGMVNSSVFIASQDGSGAVAVLTTVLESYRASLTNGTLRFDVPVPPAAEYVGCAYTIYVTVALPMNSTVQNTVWQAGPGSTGAIRKHATSGQNVQSMQRLDFFSGQSTGDSNSMIP